MKGARALSPEEECRMEAGFNGSYAVRDRALFVLGLKTGFRISELLSLQVKNVWDGKGIGDSVYVARKNMKKKTEGRSVLLHTAAKAALLPWLEELQKDEEFSPNYYLFSNNQDHTRHITPRHYLRVIHGLAARLGLRGKVCTHSWRKTFAARIYKKLDGNLLDTSKALGHKNINSTQSYLEANKDKIDSAILS